MSKKLPIVAIVGRANVGKSSLFNAILARREAIVAHEAGTTRDSITAKASWNGQDFWLVDTAGMKDAEDEFEFTIQEQIIQAADSADVIWVMVEANVAITEEDRRVAKMALKSRKPVFLVVNKVDKARGEQLPFERLGIKPIIYTSTTQHRGLSELLDLLVENIPKANLQEADDRLRIALLGRPNVGKSYLFNTLAKKQQAIVADVAGTTRDINRAVVKFGGREIELMDTAGIRRPGKIGQGIEHFSVIRSLAAIEQADICLMLMDVNELSTGLDQKIAGMIKEAGKGLILVVTKWDEAGKQSEAAMDKLAADLLTPESAPEAKPEKLTKAEKKRRTGALQQSEDVAAQSKDPFTRDALAVQIAGAFDFAPWAPLIFTSSVTGQNVTKIFELALQIDQQRAKRISTRELNQWLRQTVDKHPPAGLKNRNPKLNYITQETDNPIPAFKVFGSHTTFLHWSYKRFMEREIRYKYGYEGTPVQFWFIEKHETHKHGSSPTKGDARPPRKIEK